MTGFHQVTIGGYPSGGLIIDRKPLMLPDEAYSQIENARVWRLRTMKRLGTAPAGRLTRIFTSQALGNTGASPWAFNIKTIFSITETNSQIAIGSVTISIATIATPFLDAGDGTLTNATAGNSGTINYLTGAVVLTHTAGAGVAATITFSYYPTLPVMGILPRDVATAGVDETIFFDTVYAYQFSGGFQELSPGTTWTGSNTDFFWGANYQGVDASTRLFFATNNNLDTVGLTYDPIRYFDTSWNDLQPLITATDTLFQARIVIPYFGRLLALNTWEGATGGGFAASTNFFARCRFSQIGDPTAVDAWRSDIFGKGGFIDAPTNEQIMSVAFFRNTLLVFFEYSTWELRYIGEYGIPFIFERISSDFGSTNTYSPVIFDDGVAIVSSRGIIKAGAGGVGRIDEQLNDLAFGFKIDENAPNFVHGARDFQDQLVYWNFLDAATKNLTQTFPNKVLVYNYDNQAWSIYRDTITAFGTSQFAFEITWDSQTVSWDDSSVSWDTANQQQEATYIVSGSQHGFISIYENQNVNTGISSVTNFASSMAITGIDLNASPAEFTVPSHNLVDAEIIYITGILYDSDPPSINNQIYNVTVVDADTITLGVFDGDNYAAFSDSSSGTYIGGGEIALLPKMNIVGKDFNPFQQAGKGFKLSYIDLQMDSNPAIPTLAGVTVQLFVNSYLTQANIIGNQEVANTSQLSGLITNAQQTNPCIITSPDHSLTTGNLIYIANVIGMTQLNNALYTITVIDANNFSLDGIDASGFTAYISNGVWSASPEEGQQYLVGSQYAWYRFYSTQYGQYLRIALTYDDLLMNQLATHQVPMELNAMNIWFREGGRLPNG